MRLEIPVSVLCCLMLTACACGAQLNVREFGAAGDGSTDDTAAFQTALNKAAEEPGSVVFAPVGSYLIKTHLRVPPYVTLKGVFEAPQARTRGKGTTLLAVEGAGSPDGTPFITLCNESTLKGITVYYPDQKADQDEPTPYPWTIANERGDNQAVIDCLVVNPYQCLKFDFAGRHYIRGLYGQPLYKGIFIDNCYDVGRIENVHFWPFFFGWNAPESADLRSWMLTNATAFIFGRTDWQYVANTFVFGYNTGYRFVAGANNGCNGNFLGIAADYCNRCVVVDKLQMYGILITNGEFVALPGDDSEEVCIGPEADGVISFNNCAFWGHSNRIATIKNGQVTFSSCNLMHWDKHKRGEAAIDASGGRLTVNGCFFNSPGKAVRVRRGVEAAVIMGNHGKEGFAVDSEIGDRCQVGLNVYP